MLLLIHFRLTFKLLADLRQFVSAVHAQDWRFGFAKIMKPLFVFFTDTFSSFSIYTPTHPVYMMYGTCHFMDMVHNVTN